MFNREKHLMPFKNHLTTPSKPIRHALFALAALFLCAAACAQDGENPPAPIDLSSPQATVRTFFDAMSAVEGGNEARVSEAIACVYVGDDLEETEYMTRGAAAAQAIFEVLSHFKFMISDIPAEVPGSDWKLPLEKGDLKATLRLHRYDDGLWRFASDAVTEEMLNEIRTTAQEEETPAEDGLVFDPRMRSPRSTMQTFIRGMNETDGLTKADAWDTLDLAHVSDPNVREEMAQELSYQLKETIDRIRRVEYSELPPESEGAPYFFFQDPQGRGQIVIDRAEPGEDGLQAWKFTPGTLENIETALPRLPGSPPGRRRSGAHQRQAACRTGPRLGRRALSLPPQTHPLLAEPSMAGSVRRHSPGHGHQQDNHLSPAGAYPASIRTPPFSS